MSLDQKESWVFSKVKMQMILEPASLQNTILLLHFKHSLAYRDFTVSIRFVSIPQRTTDVYNIIKL